MAERRSRSEVHLVGDVDTEEEPRRQAASDEDAPFIVAVLGDFGAGSSATRPIRERRFVEIDRDNFDTVFARFDARWQGSLRPPGAGAAIPIELEFRELDDFHPDRIVERIQPIRQLADARRALDDPKKFDEAAAEIDKRIDVTSSAGAAKDAPREAAVRRDIDSGELLDWILRGSDAPVAPSTRIVAPDVQKFLEETVTPYLVNIDRTRQTELVDAVDRGLADPLRAILHDPAFQRLEAAWRGLRWLVHRTETGERLKIRFMHLTRKEIEDDLRSGAAEDSALVRLLIEPASIPGSRRPSLLVGNYEFSSGGGDVALVAWMGTIGEALGAPFVAAATPAFVGCRSYPDLASAGDVEKRLRGRDHEEWQALRSSPTGRWIALALPRWLCRLPYGADTDPITSFRFEEQAEGKHDTLLWANPAWLVAGVVAESFVAEGWGMRLGVTVARVEGLPLYTYEEDGEAVMKPCAEALVPQRIIEALADAGLLPLVSYPRSDSIALPAVQSIADPRFPLRWQQ